MRITLKNNFKLQPLLVWIVLFSLVLWMSTYYSLTVFKYTVSKGQQASYPLEYVSDNLTFGKCIMMIHYTFIYYRTVITHFSLVKKIVKAKNKIKIGETTIIYFVYCNVKKNM